MDYFVRHQSKKNQELNNTGCWYSNTCSWRITSYRFLTNPVVKFMAESKDETKRIHCNQCGNKTKHLVIATRNHHGSAPHDDQCEVSWDTIYDLLECCGCEEISLRRRYYFSEWNFGDVEITYYPPRVARRLPPWKNKLPDEMMSLLEEVYTALQADSRSLAMMGARAIIDMVIFKEVGDVGTFAQKLAALQKSGFLSDKNRELLDAALDVGNAASHRGHCPERKHVQNVIDIVENLLQSTILQAVVDDLKNATPKRKKK